VIEGKSQEKILPFHVHDTKTFAVFSGGFQDIVKTPWFTLRIWPKEQRVLDQAFLGYDLITEVS